MNYNMSNKTFDSPEIYRKLLFLAKPSVNKHVFNIEDRPINSATPIMFLLYTVDAHNSFLVGVFSSFEAAESVVETNDGDLNEGGTNGFCLIEPIYSNCSHIDIINEMYKMPYFWYYFDRVNKKYVSCEDPTNIKC